MIHPSGSVRTRAGWVVDQVLATRSAVERWLEPAEEGLSEVDRRLLGELVLGTLRWLRRIDWVLEGASSRPLRRIDPALRTILRLGAYQLLYLDRVPAHAAVSEAVDEAKRRGTGPGAGFVNAVLRKIARQPELSMWPVEYAESWRRLAIETSHPDFLVRRWFERFGPERTRHFLEQNNLRKPLALLSFSDRGGRQRLADQLASEGVQTRFSDLSPLGLLVDAGDPAATTVFAAGEGYVQDEASQVAAWIPPPRPQERVLDVAAAPGGKTFALLAAEPATRPVALDSSVNRISQLRENCRRLRREISIAVGDGRRPPCGATFDRVVVDVPCSGTGTFRRHPELKWRVDQQELERLARLAGELVIGASEAVTVGGIVVVIACSLELEETVGAVESLLSQRTGFEWMDLRPLLPGAWIPYLIQPGVWQLLPDASHDGFTVCVARRRE